MKHHFVVTLVILLINPLWAEEVVVDNSHGNYTSASFSFEKQENQQYLSGWVEFGYREYKNPGPDASGYDVLNGVVAFDVWDSNLGHAHWFWFSMPDLVNSAEVTKNLKEAWLEIDTCGFDYLNSVEACGSFKISMNGVGNAVTEKNVFKEIQECGDWSFRQFLRFHSRSAGGTFEYVITDSDGSALYTGQIPIVGKIESGKSNHHQTLRECK